MKIEDMSIDQILAGLKYFRRGYGSVVVANDEKKTILFRNISYKQYNELKKIDKKYYEIDYFDILDEDIDLRMYRSLERLAKIKNHIKSTDSGKVDID